MSERAMFAPLVAPAAEGERRHHLRLGTASVLAVVFFIALAVYGFDYYTIGWAVRPFSPKHAWLKPSGTIGIKLGMLGALLFLGIFLYPIRKRWPWLSRQGSSRHWLDVHVLLGLTAPVVIAFHSSFKFRGVAGMAFWIMTAVALSGIVGRYLYAQIPRSLSAAEMSLQELQTQQAQLTEQLGAQRLFPPADLEPLFHLPAIERVQNRPLVWAICAMVGLDIARPFRVAMLRRRSLGLGGKLLTLGGVLPTGSPALETVVQTARKQASLSKRILFLSRSQQVFHLWHVIHRPFSYSFAVLACIHIFVVMLLDFL